MKRKAALRNTVQFLGIFCFVAISGMIALNTMKVFARAADIRETAQLLERGAKFNPDRLHHLALAATAIAKSGSCDSVTLRSATAVVLHDLDNQNSSRDYDLWTLSVSNATDVLVATSACLPTDGNIYLRLAMVEWRVAAVNQRNAYLISLSHSYAPFELDVLKTRLLVWERMNPVDVMHVKSVFSSDFLAFKSHQSEFRLSKQRLRLLTERLENTYRSSELLNVPMNIRKTGRLKII